MLQLALEFPPLMGAMVAIAALDMGTPYHVCFAEKNYLLSLQSLWNQLAGNPNAGMEDAVLATTITLCVLEVRAFPKYSTIITQTGFIMCRIADPMRQ